MKKRTPPPSLGKQKVKRIQTVDKFGEWRILRDNIDAFTLDAQEQLAIDGYKRVRCFGFGSPRNFVLVTSAFKGGRKYYKRFRHDIRKSSHQHWWEQFNASSWETENHILSQVPD